MDALKEIARVLKPTAVFGMIWNIDDCLILSSLLHH
jgi:ubiquinone/menaquinone biosynthesis C-methylase UbiE